jgi:hypothetical protein
MRRLGALLSLLLALSVCVTLAAPLVMAADPQQGTDQAIGDNLNPVMTWTPPGLSIPIAPGETTTAHAAFTSSRDIAQATLSPPAGAHRPTSRQSGCRPACRTGRAAPQRGYRCGRARGQRGAHVCAFGRSSSSQYGTSNLASELLGSPVFIQIRESKSGFLAK